MEGIGVLLNGYQFGIGFGEGWEVLSGVVSLVIVGASGALTKIGLEGMFKDLPRISLSRRYGKALLGLGVSSIEETFATLVEPNSKIACPKVVSQNRAFDPNMGATVSSGWNRLSLTHVGVCTTKDGFRDEGCFIIGGTK